MDQTPPPPPTTTTTTPQPDPPTPTPTPAPAPAPTPTPTRPPITNSPNSQQTTPRPSFNTRPWTPQQQSQQSQQQNPSHFTLPSTPTPRIAIGIPSPQPPPVSFASLASPSYQQSHIRQPMQGIPISGSLGTNTRPPVVGSVVIRPNNSNNSNSNGNGNGNSSSTQSPTPAPFQGHGMIRVTTSPAPNGANQPWLSGTTTTTTIAQGKPPLPSPSTLRPQQQPFQQRPQQVQTNEQHYGAHFTPPRSITQQQQQMARGMPAAAALGSQKLPLGISQAQTGVLSSGVGNRVSVAVEMEEVSNRIVTKRSIRDLLNQIDPSEKFEPGVEDALVDIAEEFVESITRSGCSLAKHRKSSVLEAKDVLLHLERNWNLTLPGFGGDEIKTYKKPVVSDVHRERIAAIKKSSAVSDTGAGTKSLGGQSGGNTKTYVAKAAAATTEAA